MTRWLAMVVCALVVRFVRSERAASVTTDARFRVQGAADSAATLHRVPRPTRGNDLGDARVDRGECSSLTGSNVEQMRYRTAHRMRGLVDLFVTALGWPAGGGDPNIVEAPKRLARLVGAPVVHASIVGPVQSAAAPDGSGSLTLQFTGRGVRLRTDLRSVRLQADPFHT